MIQPTGAPYPISDFLQWQGANQLVLVPKFQRRDVWSQKAKSYLVDTVLKKMPMPPIYLRLGIDPKKKHMVREVVDGQQRIRAILQYIKGEFTVMAVHNTEFADKTYSELPEDVQRDFLSYKFMVYTLENISDSDILNMFARLNTYVEKLNSQELLNAEFFGAFKQSVYSLAHKHYAFWTNNKILSDKQVARMGDAKFVSEVVVCILDGIRQTKTADLKEFYKKHDDKFPRSSAIAAEFSDTISTLGECVGEKLKEGPFRRLPLFFSLFLALYDAKYGLPNSSYEKQRLTADRIRQISKNLTNLISDMSSDKPSKSTENLVEAAARATADPSKRRLRHKIIMDRVIMA